MSQPASPPTPTDGNIIVYDASTSGVVATPASVDATGNLYGLYAYLKSGVGFANNSILNITTVSIATADLLSLSVTPVLIVPAPGAGLYVFPLFYVLEYVYGGVAFSTPLSTNNAFFGFTGESINNTNSPIAITAWGTFIKSTASSLLFGLVGNAANIGSVLSQVENKGINFGVPNALTLGNGSMKATLAYLTLPA